MLLNNCFISQKMSFVCSICFKKFRSKRGLQTHEGMSHKNENERRARRNSQMLKAAKKYNVTVKGKKRAQRFEQSLKGFKRRKSYRYSAKGLQTQQNYKNLKKRRREEQLKKKQTQKEDEEKKLHD